MASKTGSKTRSSRGPSTGSKRPGSTRTPAAKPGAKKSAPTSAKPASGSGRTRREAAAHQLDSAEKRLVTVKKLESRVSQKLTSDAQRARNVKRSLRASEKALTGLADQLKRAKGARKDAAKKLAQLH